MLENFGGEKIEVNIRMAERFYRLEFCDLLCCVCFVCIGGTRLFSVCRENVLSVSVTDGPAWISATFIRCTGMLLGFMLMHDNAFLQAC